MLRFRNNLYFEELIGYFCFFKLQRFVTILYYTALNLSRRLSKYNICIKKYNVHNIHRLFELKEAREYNMLLIF